MVGVTPRLAAVVVALLAALTLWLWPLMYAFSADKCGADIGIGLFGLPGAFFGVVACVVLGAKYRRDRVLLALCVSGGVAGSLSLFGLVADAPPYAQWLGYAIDHWYGTC